MASSVGIDILSDVHIDYWAPKQFTLAHPCGTVCDAPYVHATSKDTRILVVAGDISDDLHVSLQFLKTLSPQYEAILFIDGNHEHAPRFPDLYKISDIRARIEKLGCPNIVYLTTDTYRKGSIAFVGACGWWDYYTEKHDPGRADRVALRYFRQWMPAMTKEQSRLFAYNVGKRAEHECNDLERRVRTLSCDPTVDRIVVVTHSIPHPRYTRPREIICDCNTGLRRIYEDANMHGKLTHWIFGHVHEAHDESVAGIRYICNPRGRIDDTDGKIIRYKPLRALL